ncbi:hypothetical protein J4H86_05820 [Spiractinospora alimapuensis]|uniref:hypothetical protein n=1 Tax=Spiractinospora alimapuensis TaxID=2820884 RepID=UPI001F3D3256|nr:hypothetical protein [Spiractinospora alimapuensis]QVQ53288.1 hypothetical protein J4H86_05820 [Spiractinospora alimapuensis]
MDHPLLAMFVDAAAGVFPPVDGRAVVVPPLADGHQAVVSFTGHAVIATRWAASDLGDPKLDGYGAALHPRVLRRIAGERGTVGQIDVTMVARGSGDRDPGNATCPLAERVDLLEHPRVRHATALRRDVRVFADERGLVTIAAGLAGRREMSIETAGNAGAGHGRSLLRDALRLVPEGEEVFAAVSPGNARSLRAFLAVGFVPLGSEVIIADHRW